MTNPRLQISICNNQDIPIEPVQTIETPAVVKRDSIWWGYTFYMQTPIENLGNDFSIIVRFMHGSVISALPISRYRIDKEVIDSGPTRFNFSSTGDNSGAASAGRSVSTANPSSDSSMLKRMTFAAKKPVTANVEAAVDCALEAEIEITKFFRDIDIEDMGSEPIEPKKFAFVPTGKSGGSLTPRKDIVSLNSSVLAALKDD